MWRIGNDGVESGATVVNCNDAVTLEFEHSLHGSTHGWVVFGEDNGVLRIAGQGHNRTVLPEKPLQAWAFIVLNVFLLCFVLILNQQLQDDCARGTPGQNERKTT